jgi:hypothetical protein
MVPDAERIRARHRRHAFVYRRRRLLASAVVTLTGSLVVIGITDHVGGEDAGQTAPTSSDVVAPATTAEPNGPAPVPTVPSTPTTPTVPTSTDVDTLIEPLRVGSSGDVVARLQDRLGELGFEPGPSDGEFGALTEQAVWAFEKLVAGVPAAEATGVVTDELWDLMRAAAPIEPRRRFADGQTTRNHTEVYLPEQAVAFFVDDRAILVSHMSSGSGERWRETVTIGPGEYHNEDGTRPIQLGLVGQSITPGGVYIYDRIVTGRRLGALGAMYDPAYFNHGIAVHGADYVPLHPASHGCIRVPRYISDRFHELIDRGDQVWVWDGDSEPEWLGQVPPPSDQIDPNWIG